MSEESGFGMPLVGRREALGVAGVAVCGLALTGCGGQQEPVKSMVPPGIKGKPLAKTADIPVGGGKVFPKWKIVVTQPTAGVYKAFSAVCTHKGCLVAAPEKDVISCPCHGSEFAAGSGKMLKGPAAAPLPEFTAKVEGDDIIIV